MTTLRENETETSVDDVLDVLTAQAEGLREELAATERAIDTLVNSGLASP